jgi:hypothetical protein
MARPASRKAVSSLPAIAKIDEQLDEVVMWVVQQKVSDDGRSVEISAISTANDHGRSSWGWHNPDDKFIVLSVKSLYQASPIADVILDAAKKEAQRICDENNSQP